MDGSKRVMIKELRDVDKDLDQGVVFDSLISKRHEVTRQLQDINSREAADFIQKSKVRWAIEGDENSKYFHGIINKKRSQLAIRGVFVDDRQILDGPFIFNEVIHWCKRLNKKAMF
nr:RNA-directed DNA polymerase, eukaryota [Tanacetum cinerariifolium]